jgi:uncharacterized protein (TIGR03503 family)
MILRIKELFVQHAILPSLQVLQTMSCLRGWLACLILLVPTLLSAETVSDVRLLIDVSGSMKKNDPANLRAPAVKMLVGLLPENTRSGIWTFGRYVNMQVKLDQVNQTWKQQAMLEAEKIHSRGLFTNIEEAIARSTRDWQQPDPKFDRHLILLTDGMVDIGKDARLNEQSRQRILAELLPQLEAADATIHSIALSENADAELLNNLSGATKGSFAQVDSAEQLQRIFLKMFEKSVKPDILPIEDNKFKVDKHVSDITVLVFLAKDSPDTQLSTPDGQTWSANKHPAAVSWHHEQGYDLITVKQPTPGEWNLQAKVDPDNRVMVVSNLRLKVDKLPHTIMPGDQFDVRARLIEEGKTVTNQNLLSKTEFEISKTNTDSQIKQSVLMDNGNSPDVIKGDGVYSLTLTDFTRAGEHELSIQAKSLTFTRMVRHSLQVYASPASIEISQEANDKPFEVTIKPHAGLIRPESVSMQITLPNGDTAIARQGDEHNWLVEVPSQFAGKKFSITLAGTRYTDDPIQMEFEQRVAITDKAKSLTLKTDPPENPQSDVTQEESQAQDKPDPETSSGVQAEHDVAEGFSWWIVIALVIGVNLLVIGGGWFAYRGWKRRQQQEEEEVKEALTNE